MSVRVWECRKGAAPGLFLRRSSDSCMVNKASAVGYWEAEVVAAWRLVQSDLCWGRLGKTSLPVWTKTSLFGPFPFSILYFSSSFLVPSSLSFFYPLLLAFTSFSSPWPPSLFERRKAVGLLQYRNPPMGASNYLDLSLLCISVWYLLRCYAHYWKNRPYKSIVGNVN